ncbi:hypothetical protein [Halomonas sp.]|uniref:hypothetical protein n=1 Tax=Halomonas sp. TaxID=1486246 RepID=UPI00298E110D|nr:hypothetical protein [Halomonas sp.]MDW7748818.1 hypothetical protein [Halomonas sp.]
MEMILSKNINILKEANQAFRDKRYEKALEMYEQAAHLYGKRIVEINIQVCLKYLGREKHTRLKFDEITQLLLENSDKIKLNEKERTQALMHYEELTSKKSETLPVKPVNPVPSDWPEGLELAPLPDGPNDYDWYVTYR